MDFNNIVAFILVSDLDLYQDWDNHEGFSGNDQLINEELGGIIVLKSEFERFDQHIKAFEKYVLDN